MPATNEKFWLKLFLAMVLVVGYLPLPAAPMTGDCCDGMPPAVSAAVATSGEQPGGHGQAFGQGCCQGERCLDSHCVTAASIPAAEFVAPLQSDRDAPLAKYCEFGPALASVPLLPPPILQPTT